MTGARVAIVAPGSMGAAVGAHLRAHGASVSTCLAGRSASSAERARAAGLTVVADEVELVRTADLFLSIVPPGGAAETAQRIAAAMRRAGAAPVYVECNALAPETARDRPYGDRCRHPVRRCRHRRRPAAARRHRSALLHVRARPLRNPRPARSRARRQACRLRDRSGVRPEDVLRDVVEGVGGAGRAAARGGEDDGGIRRAPGPVPRLGSGVRTGDGAAASRDAAEGLPVGRRDGGDGQNPSRLRAPWGYVQGRAARLYEMVARSPLGREATERRARGHTLEELVETLALRCGAAPGSVR